MNFKKVSSLFVLGGLMVLGSCSDDYDERFDKLERELQDVIVQLEGAAELSTAIAALESQIATLKDAVGDLPEGNALSGGLSALEDQITALETELASLAETRATSEDLDTLIAGLASDLDLLKEDLAELLENSNVLTGDLVIFDQSSLDAALSLGDRVSIVNGSVRVIGDDLEAGALDAVTSKIVAVTNDVHVKTDKSLDFSNLETIGDDLGILGAPIDLSALKSIGGDMELFWDGDYDFPGLAVVGNAIRLGVAGDEEDANGGSFLEGVPRIINFRNVTAPRVESYYGAFMNLESGVYNMEIQRTDRRVLRRLHFPNATSVIFGNVRIRFVFAPVAETVELHYDGETPRLRILTSAGNVTAKASEVTRDVKILAGGKDIDFDGVDIEDLSLDDALDIIIKDDATFFWDYEVSEDWNAHVNLPNLQAVGQDMYVISNTLTMPMLEGFDIDENDYYLLLTQENVSLPNLTVERDLYTSRTVSAELASISTTYMQDASILESLKLNAQLNDATDETIGVYDFPALSSLTIIGSTELEGEEAIEVDLDGEVFDLPALEALELGGLIYQASIVDLEALTALITSGNINELSIDNNDALVTLTLGHEHISGLDGASLDVDNNDALENLVTENLDYVAYLTVERNDNLSSMDFSSMKTAVNAWAGEGDDVYIYISENDIFGTIVEYQEETGTTAEQLGVLNTADLYSLKALIDALEDSDLNYRVDIYVDNVEDLEGNDVGSVNIDTEADDDITWTWTSEAGVINFDDYYFD
ncbi:hypothetical protein [Flagellimonas marinaquae]